LIIVTQSCDLANNKVEFAALCPIFRLDRFEAENPDFRRKGKWEEVRKGRIEGLHLLASPTAPSDNREALVVDFGLIVSLPVSSQTRRNTPRALAAAIATFRLTIPFPAA